MSEHALTPDFGAVAGAQIRAVGQAIRREAVVAGGLLGVMLVVGSIIAVSEGDSMGLGHIGGLGVLTGLASFLLPVAVWKGEERFGCTTLWTLPVDHARHALVKAGAGWVWAMAFSAAFVLAMVLAALATGGSIGETLPRLVADPSAPFGAREVAWSTPWWFWLVPFASASTAYLLGSALVLATDHPWRWILGGLVGFWIFGFLGEEGDIDWMARIFDTLLFDLGFGRYGIDAFVTGGSESNAMRFELPNGEMARGWRELPSIARWGWAVLLWSGIGLVGMLAAVWRHREG